MKVTVIIEDSGSGLQITGATAAVMSAANSSAAAFDGGAGPAISTRPGSAGAPAPFMAGGPQASGLDVAAGGAPGAAVLESREGEGVGNAAGAPRRARGRAPRPRRRG